TLPEIAREPPLRRGLLQVREPRLIDASTQGSLLGDAPLGRPFHHSRPLTRGLLDCRDHILHRSFSEHAGHAPCPYHLADRTRNALVGLDRDSALFSGSHPQDVAAPPRRRRSMTGAAVRYALQVSTFIMNTSNSYLSPHSDPCRIAGSIA